ncbi:hypothetical protein AALP_AA6G218800 [Arabis alpina]|uniref:Uncharacterized protein n=1 Tax=Arabis alpina TaxID=50452 RepID=A0A087GQV5_ARAAL|nr:hypothetical protein AALP_AA6G218800 [Arabis alpina]
MPSFSREVFKQLNLPPHFSFSDERGEVSQASRLWEILPHNHRIGTPQPLFKALSERLAREAEAARKRAMKQAAAAHRQVRKQAEAEVTTNPT